MESLAFVIFVILIGGLVLVLGGCSYYILSQKAIGNQGEKQAQMLLSHLPEEYKVIHDLVLPTNNGTTQIDHLVVSKYGIFVIETKNYRGDIYGNEDAYEWKQVISTDVTYSKKWWKTYTYVNKYTLYNPVRQSKGHIYALRQLLNNSYGFKFFPIVVFIGDCCLNGVKSSVPVLYGKDLLQEIIRHKEVCMSETFVAAIYDTLLDNNMKNKVSDSQHAESVRKAKMHNIDLINQGICPQCGGDLVLRKGRYGDFYGCSNYPKCRFTIK